MGTTLREIIEIYGGGMKGGKAFKAAQTGGSSGTIIPAELLDVPMDFASMREKGRRASAVARCSSVTRTRTLSTWPMSWFGSSRLSLVASARRAVWATPRCWRPWSACARGWRTASDLERLGGDRELCSAGILFLWIGTGRTGADSDRSAVLP